MALGFFQQSGCTYRFARASTPSVVEAASEEPGKHLGMQVSCAFCRGFLSHDSPGPGRSVLFFGSRHLAGHAVGGSHPRARGRRASQGSAGLRRAPQGLRVDFDLKRGSVAPKASSV